MKKRILMMLAVAVLLTGCGNADKKDSDVNTSQTETENTTDMEDSTHTHTYTENITKEASCTENGEKTFSCSCGDSYTEPIEPLGHNYETVVDSSVEATCTTDGKKADTKCTLCGDVINGEAISATGHSYGDYVYNNDATTSKDGTETATCSVCGDKNTRTKAGTQMALESFPYALNSPWYDEATGEVYFYTVGTADPTLEPYTSAFNLLRQYYGEYGLCTVGSKFNEYVGTYAEGEIYLSSAKHIEKFWE